MLPLSYHQELTCPLPVPISKIDPIQKLCENTRTIIRFVIRSKSVFSSYMLIISQNNTRMLIPSSFHSCPLCFSKDGTLLRQNWAYQYVPSNQHGYEILLRSLSCKSLTLSHLLSLISGHVIIFCS